MPAFDVYSFFHRIGRSFFEVEDDFAIPFEDACFLLGYDFKRNEFEDLLIGNFQEDTDYRIDPPYQIFLKRKCFREISMMAETPQGRKIRKYLQRLEKETRSRAIGLTEKEIDSIILRSLRKTWHTTKRFSS